MNISSFRTISLHKTLSRTIQRDTTGFMILGATLYVMVSGIILNATDSATLLMAWAS